MRYIIVVGDIFPFVLFAFSSISVVRPDIPSITVKREVKNVGFHRDLETIFNMEILPKDLDNCTWAVRENIPCGIYVDPDQLMDLERSNLTRHKMKIIGAVNVEAPQHKSMPHELMIYFNDNITQSMNIVTKFPFHLRYHMAVSGGGYTMVKISKPLLLARCNEQLPRTDVIRAPCFHHTNQECIWSVIPFKEIDEDIVIEVPVGNLDHDTVVATITIIVIIIGCLAIVSPFSRK